MYTHTYIHILLIHISPHLSITLIQFFFSEITAGHATKNFVEMFL